MGTEAVVVRGRSAFAKALSQLLDDTKVFDRSGWAEYLGVEEDQIESWMNDTSLPPAATLRAVLALVSSSIGREGRPVLEFLALANQPICDVTPCAGHTDIRLGDYIVSPLREGFLLRLATLSVDEQEEVLTAACRAFPPP